MIKKATLVAIVLFSLLISHAQERNPFYIGHSLVNHNMPVMVQAMATDAGKITHHDRQIGIGAPLHINYNNPADAQGTPYTNAFPNGNYNTLVITEAVPLQNHLSWSDTYQYANDFYTYAKNNNNGQPIRFYIYETWHCTNSGLPAGCSYDNTANSNTPWHPRLQVDFPLWSGIVDHVRIQNPLDTQIWMIPGGQAFYDLTTEINAGNVPGINNFTDLFSDDIHLTNAGNYFIACVMYATIYRESPAGLTTAINNQWGVPFTNMPTTAQAAVMQQVAWNTVSNLSTWTGVSSALPRIELQAKAFLEGAYDNTTGLMRDDLRVSSLIPTAEPFENLGFSLVNSGGESFDSNLLNTTGNDALVDWVLLELRDKTDPTLLVATQSALLQRDGDIVSIDGTSPVGFETLAPDAYYISITHRNHLRVTTASTISLSTSLNSLDFSNGTTVIAGTNPQVDFGNGVFGSYAGNATTDNAINAADRSETWNRRNQNAYFTADVNMDGVCSASDRSITWNNRNKVSVLQ